MFWFDIKEIILGWSPAARPLSGRTLPRFIMFLIKSVFAMGKWGSWTNNSLEPNYILGV